MRKAKELAERDLKAGDTLSPEFEAVGDLIGKVGALRGHRRRRDDLLHDVQTVPIADASKPVAMFDSGVGGLTVLHECLVSLPEEDFVYLGDTAMFPYGPVTRRACASASARSPSGCSATTPPSCW